MNHTDSHVHMTAPDTITRGFWHAAGTFQRSMTLRQKTRGELSRVSSVHRCRRRAKRGLPINQGLLSRLGRLLRQHDWSLVGRKPDQHVLLTGEWSIPEAATSVWRKTQGRRPYLRYHSDQRKDGQRRIRVKVRQQEWRRKAHFKKGGKHQMANRSCAFHHQESSVTFHSQEPWRVPKKLKTNEGICKATFTHPTVSWRLHCGELGAQTKNRS